jgi:hypothetical protein
MPQTGRSPGETSLLKWRGKLAGRDIEYLDQLSGGAASAHLPDALLRGPFLLLASLGACIVTKN